MKIAAVRAAKECVDDYLAKPILLSHLLGHFDRAQSRGELFHDDEPAISGTAMSLRRTTWEHVQRVVAEVVVECAGNISAAARQLNMHRRTLQRMLAKRPTPR